MTEKKNHKIEIYNSQGNVVKQIESEQNKSIINIEDLLSGIYFIKLSCTDFNYIGKVVKIKNPSN
ncbi:MAG: T9SS type A sorting domain-containing protein [Bacteroidota bacterium]